MRNLSRLNRAGRAALFVLALAATLAVPGLAEAEWREIPAPVAPMYSMTVANADTWLAEGTLIAHSYEVTGDGGAHWTAVTLPGLDSAFVAGAAADGTFRVVSVQNSNQAGQEAQVFRITAAGAIEALGPPIDGPSGVFGQIAASPSGETWVPHREPGGGGWVLTIVGTDGSVANLALPGSGADEWKARSTALGMRLLHYVPNGAGEAYAGQTYRVEAGQVLPAEAYPVSLAEGAWEVSGEFGRGSWDGGVTWGEEQGVGVIPRAPGLGMPRYLSVRGGTVAERYSASLYRGTGLSWPVGAPTNYVVDAGPLIAWGSERIFVDEGSLPPMPAAIGELQPDTQKLIDRADVFRADAGLPPLTGDAQVSVASRNHSNYTLLNPEAASQEPHGEYPGLAGYTGEEMDERCAAVGTFCDSEIMYGPGTIDPVAGWLATVYHRPLIGAPEAGVVGGGEVPGGWAVMDSRKPTNVLVGPFGYPVGRWRGAEGFSGEIPDPVAACQAAGQPISYPVGIAVSLYLPNRESTVSAIHVHKQGDVADLPGCLLSDETEDAKAVDSFILDEPLVRGTTYEAVATWNPGPDELPGAPSKPSADRTYAWSFNFDPDNYGQAPEVEAVRQKKCRVVNLRTLASVNRARHIRRSVPGIELKLGLSRKASMRIDLARLEYRSGHRRRSVKLKLGRLAHRAVAVGPSSLLRLRLPGRLAAKLASGGPARLRLHLSGTPVGGGGCQGNSTFSRLRRVRPGWVRMKGQAEWTSGRPKPIKRRR
ncbi:MAG TPA: hypothetical protein VHZ54_17200 [Solirubrobacterales bacterium]|jgi:hypothetical protein|nr:hypothetical protein [Solirubrobacterales bacterium]